MTDKNQTQDPGLAAIDRIGNEADELANAATAPAADPNAPAEPGPVNYQAEAAQTIDFFAAMVTGYAPATASIWDADCKARVSASLAPVLEKYGVTLGTLPPELMLLIAAGPPLYQSARVIAAQMQADKAKATPGQSQDKMSAPVVAADSGPEVARHPQTALY